MKTVTGILFFLVLIGAIKISNAQYKEGDWSQRDTWMKVSEILELSDINSGSFVADIGCHEGYLSIHMAKRVGNAGKVYAVDVRKDRLEELDKHLEQRKLTNVTTILGDYDNPKLPEGILDAVIILDTYHEIDAYMQVLKHVRKSLKPDGRIMIIEKLKNHLSNKTREEQMEGHTLSMKYAKTELEDAGFSIQKEIKDFGNWKNDTDKKIWILVAVPTIR